MVPASGISGMRSPASHCSRRMCSKLLEAQLKEMKEYERFEVAVEVDDSEAWEITGEGPVASRWKVINKGDAANVDVRARLIAKQFKKAGADYIFAPTPPLSGFRLLCSSAATRRPDERGSSSSSTSSVLSSTRRPGSRPM